MEVQLKKRSKKNKTPPVNPLTDLSNTFIQGEPPPEPPDLHDLPPRKDYLVYSRADWEARPPLEGIPTVELPAATVVYTAEYHGYTPPCRNKEECVKSMRQLQSLYMDEKGLPDIPYNFVIGGDGNIYEGRGWNKKPEKSLKYEEYKKNTIDIGMITHYVHEPENKIRELESSLFDVLLQFVQDHSDDKVISTEFMFEGFTGIRKY